MQKPNFLLFLVFLFGNDSFPCRMGFHFCGGIGMTNFVLDENHHRISLLKACFFLRNIAPQHLVSPHKFNTTKSCVLYQKTRQRDLSNSVIFLTKSSIYFRLFLRFFASLMTYLKSILKYLQKDLCF